jgi:hypothetical protein
MMVEVSHCRQGPHLTYFRWLDSAGLGAIHSEGQMGTKAMVIGNIRGEHAPEMPVVEDDDMIEHIAPDTPDEPLAVGILPRAVGRNLDLLDTQVLDP